MTIKARQNEEDILELLYLARISYNKASKYNVWIFLLTVISVISSILGAFSVQLILVIVITLLNIFKIKNIKLGADAKKYIDRTLFEFDLEFNKSKKEYLKNKALEIIEKNQEDYNLKKANDGSSNIRGIKDWYDIGNKTGLDGIYQCQRENLYWDKNLVSKYATILIILLIGSVGLLFLVDKFSTKGILEIVSSYYNILSTLGLELFGVIGYITYSIRIDEKKDSCENTKNLEDKERQILALQEKIEKRRRQLYAIPDVLHKINSSKYHKRWKNCKVV